MTRRTEAAALFGTWLIGKDWRDLFPSKRDTASWSLLPHRVPRDKRQTKARARRGAARSSRWSARRVAPVRLREVRSGRARAERRVLRHGRDELVDVGVGGDCRARGGLERARPASPSRSSPAPATSQPRALGIRAFHDRAALAPPRSPFAPYRRRSWSDLRHDQLSDRSAWRGARAVRSRGAWRLCARRAARGRRSPRLRRRHRFPAGDELDLAPRRLGRIGVTRREQMHNLPGHLAEAEDELRVVGHPVRRPRRVERQLELDVLDPLDLGGRRRSMSPAMSGPAGQPIDVRL